MDQNYLEAAEADGSAQAVEQRLTGTGTTTHAVAWNQGYADAAIDQMDDEMAGNPDVASGYMAGWQAHQFDHPEFSPLGASVADPVNTLHYFGACPLCGGTDGYINYHRTHWFLCHAHKTIWCAGANLFSDWQMEDESIWQANAEKFGHYREVEPLEMDDCDDRHLLIKEF